MSDFWPSKTQEQLLRRSRLKERQLAYLIIACRAENVNVPQVYLWNAKWYWARRPKKTRSDRFRWSWTWDELE